MKRSICGVRRDIPVTRPGVRSRPLRTRAVTCCSSAPRRLKTTRTGSFDCCSCCDRRIFRRRWSSRRVSMKGRRCRRAPAPRVAPTLAACRRASAFRSTSPTPRKPSCRSRWRRRCEARPRPTPLPSATRSIESGGHWRLVRRLRPSWVLTETALRAQALAMDAADPRVEWLVSQAPRWRDAKEKTLVFVAHRETLEMLRETLSRRAQLATGVFHEALTPARRDTEVALFRDSDGPSLLVSTECGGEGRNFEFCRRLVLFDLPWKPSVVEQRIGRLDRIGRKIPVEVVYFRPPNGIGRDVVRLFEALGLFREPLAGLEPQLAPVEGALESIAVDPDASLSDARFNALIGEAHAARTRIREAAYQQLHREPYRPEMAPGILARVPKELDELNQEVVVTASIGLGFSIAHPPGHRVFSIELASGATGRWLTGRARPARATSAPSIVRKRSPTSRSTSSRPGIRWSKASLRITRTAPLAARCGSRSRWAQRSSAGHRRDLQGRARLRGGGDRRGRQRETGLGGGGLAATDHRPPRHRRGREGSGLAEHGSPARGSTRPDASSACGRGD